jgi:hypothetical protein
MIKFFCQYIYVHVYEALVEVRFSSKGDGRMNAYIS